jgi:hypothetical protein
MEARPLSHAEFPSMGARAIVLAKERRKKGMQYLLFEAIPRQPES